MSFFMPLANAAMGTVATKATNNVISRTHAALTGSKKKKKSRRTSSKLMRSSVRKSPRTKTITRTYSTMSKSKKKGGRRSQHRRRWR
ncbi:hypothetical protein CVIRNUC_004605 [Coccomyxa viridis]|uniref:Uncharacterized protein n=2 Tax=Coccomyxa viridis TaxID=1274662 RepID=A0AAV1I5S1_9CHLO|nr:hypothetical protein CVIRNUC_004605 [Coccomyxa viridis]